MKSIPEYPHNPTAHLNKPTTINIRGSITHCDVELRADQSKDANGYVGRFPLVRLAFGSSNTAFLDCCPRDRGLCGEGETPAIVTEELKSSNIQLALLELKSNTGSQLYLVRLSNLNLTQIVGCRDIFSFRLIMTRFNLGVGSSKLSSQ